MSPCPAIRSRLPARALGALIALLLVLAGPAGPAAAQEGPGLGRLVAALRVADTVAIMRREGLAYATDLGAEMMPGLDRVRWRARLEALYDEGRMRAAVEQSLARDLAAVDPGPLLAFFGSALGARAVALELSTREAFLDPAVEAAAKAHYVAMAAEEAPLVDLIDTMIADSDLVERNVAGALNANLMLYRGLADGGAWDMGEDETLREVWAQEESMREESRAWLGGYLLTAYAPLGEAGIGRYIALWRTPEGRALNAALFAAYDGLYEQLSYLVGRALAEDMRAQEL